MYPAPWLQRGERRVEPRPMTAPTRRRREIEEMRKPQLPRSNNTMRLWLPQVRDSEAKLQMKRGGYKFQAKYRPQSAAMKSESRPCTAQRPEVDRGLKIRERYKKEWQQRLVPNGLKRDFQVWEDDDNERIAAMLNKIAVKELTRPRTAPHTCTTALEKQPETMDSPTTQRLRTFPITRILEKNDNLDDISIQKKLVLPHQQEYDLHTNIYEAREAYFQQLRLVQRQRDVFRINASESVAVGAEEIDGNLGDLTQDSLNAMGANGHTPRQEFLRDLMSQRSSGTLPLPVLLRRNMRTPNILDLNGHGLGDTIIIALNHVITTLPGLDTLLLADNRLTDCSLTPLCASAVNLPSLTALDLSGNDVDESAKSIRLYLAQRKCNLRKLWLAKSDIDDHECADFMSALHSNCSLEVLSLSNNLIGDAEALNVVNPDILTGGEAIGDMLLKNFCLTDLDLSWNKIRKESAVVLGSALSSNVGLTRLNLSHNGFADDATQYLGLALAENSVLRELDLSYNSVKTVSSLVLANAFGQNNTLTTLNLSGNPVGKRGGEALVTAVRRYQLPDRFLRIDLTNADLELETGSLDHTGVLFNPTCPHGEYGLDMSTPYAQMVAHELYRLASTNQACSFKSIVWHPLQPSVENQSDSQPHLKINSHGISIQLVRTRAKRTELVSQLRESFSAGLKSDTSQHYSEWYHAAKDLETVLSSLKVRTEGDTGTKKNQIRKALKCLFTSLKVKPSSICIDAIADKVLLKSKRDLNGVEGAIYAVLIALFDSIDGNRSGAIDVREMCRCLCLLGVPDASMELAHRVMATYDVDGTGQIERNEFVHWCMSALLGQKLDKLNSLLDTRTKAPWRIPKDGLLKIVFLSEPRLPGVDLFGTDIGNFGLIRNIQLASNDFERARILEKAVTNTDIFFTRSQAQDILDKCNVGMSKHEKLALLLPVMASAADVNALLDQNLNLHERAELRERIGALFDACSDNPTGFYNLDLQNERDRKAAYKLAEVNTDQMHVGKASGRGDTSQKGNWNNFRNEFLDDRPFEITSAFFPTMPKKGKLRFDFVSTRRQTKNSCSISMRRFLQLCNQIDLPQLQSVEKYYQYIPFNERHQNTFFSLRNANVAATTSLNSIEGVSDVEAKCAEQTPAKSDTEQTTVPVKDIDVSVNPIPSNIKPEFDDEDSVDSSDSNSSSRSAADDSSDDSTHASLRKKPKDIRTVLGVPVPTWIYRKDVVQRWRGIKQSSHLKLGWLGEEKSRRDMCKLSGATFDDVTEVSSKRLEKPAPPRRRTLRPKSSKRKRSAAKIASQQGHSIKTARNGRRIAVLHQDNDDMRNETSASHFGSQTHEDGNKIAAVAEQVTKPRQQSRRSLRRSFSRNSVDASGLTFEARADDCFDDGDNENDFMPFDFVPSKYSRFDAKSVPSKAYTVICYKLSLLRVATMSLSLTTDQVISIIKQFPSDEFSRVYAAVALHSRVSDLQNFYRILKHLEAIEQVELIHRLGWLNVMNSMHPDHAYVLDLRWRDHRELCKVLVRLAVEEPGTNWIDEAYRWSIKDDPVPGWALPFSWCTKDHEAGGEGGPRRFGRLRVRYTSDPHAGCAPNWKVRKELELCFLSGEPTYDV